MLTTINAVQTGKPKPIDGDKLSSIFKEPKQGPIAAGPMGLEGDTQVDKEHHGGIDKAIHIYTTDHYAYWQATFPEQKALFTSGSFGENIVASGLLEEDICLGDQFICGSAILEITQGRQPCWKLAKRFNIDRLPLMVERTGKTGFYCRVIQNGEIAAGNSMQLQTRQHPDWPLTRLWQTIFRKGARAADLQTLMGIPELSEAWRERTRKKLSAIAAKTP